MTKKPVTKEKTAGIETKSKTKSKSVFSCTTCGRLSSKRVHLSAPVKDQETYICAYCEKTTAEPRHVCLPMVA
ncbi:MAG: hypothetical protein HY815_12345 [Candidatus Riflebacteria bacterium]|nr:hypothetical protein [Candidatus Riflebacteria bacterium]